MHIRVVFVSEVRLYRDGLAALLHDEPRIDLVSASSRVADVRQMVCKHRAHAMLFDLAIPDAFQVARPLAETSPGVRLLGFGVKETESEVIACAEAGMVGYVTRNASVDTLVQCIEAALSDELNCSPKIAASLLRRVRALTQSTPSPTACLTRRQKTILGLIEQGYPNKQIARELNIELATVKNHVHSIFDRLHVHSRTEAAAVSRRGSR